MLLQRACMSNSAGDRRCPTPSPSCALQTLLLCHTPKPQARCSDLTSSISRAEVGGRCDRLWDR